jgi:hypothetical protein
MPALDCAVSCGTRKAGRIGPHTRCAAAIMGCGSAPGKLPDGGVSERPKEHASKACDG